MVLTRTARAMEKKASEEKRSFATQTSPETWGAVWLGAVWGRGLHTLSTTLRTTIDTGLFTSALVSPPPVSPLLSLPVPLCPPSFLGRRLGGGKGGVHRSTSLGVSLWGGWCSHSPSGCNTVVRAMHLYPPRTNGCASYPGTPAVPHTGVRYIVGHQRSPCRADVSLAGPDGQCVLPTTPHLARNAIHALGTAPWQAHWPPPQAGASMGRWPAVPGVSRVLALAQAGPIRSAGGLPNPSS